MDGNLENLLNHGACLPELVLQKYLAGDLSTHDVHLVEKHLLDCPFCSDAVEGLKLLAPEKIKTVTEQLNREIDERLDSGRQRKSRIIPIYRRYRIAAAIALFIIAGGTYWYLSSVTENQMLTQQVKQQEESSSNYPVPELPQLMQDGETAPPEERKELKKPAIALNENQEAASTSITAEKEIVEETKADKDQSAKDLFTITGSPNQAPIREKEIESDFGNVVSTAEPVSRSASGVPAAAESEVVTFQSTSGMKKATDETKVSADKQAENPSVVFERARANYDQKKFAEAETDFEKLVTDSSNTNFDEVNWLLANCYMKTKKNAKARKILRGIANSDSKYRKDAFGLLQELQ